MYTNYSTRIKLRKSGIVCCIISLYNIGFAPFDIWSLCLIGCSPLLGRAGPIFQFPIRGIRGEQTMMTNLGQVKTRRRTAQGLVWDGWEARNPILDGRSAYLWQIWTFRACTTRGLLELPNLNGHPSKNGWLCGPCSQRLDSIHLQSFDALVSLQIHSNYVGLARLAQILFDIWTMAKLYLGKLMGCYQTWCSAKNWRTNPAGKLWRNLVQAGVGPEETWGLSIRGKQQHFWVSWCFMPVFQGKNYSCCVGKV